MTVVIGSQTDVPAPGDPIVSPWHQDTSRKLVHVFASTAARDAWVSPPNGAVCEAPAGTWYNRVAGAWVPMAGYIRSGSAPAGDAPIGGVLANAASISLPAGRHLVSYVVLLNSTAGLKVNLKLLNVGVTAFVFQIATADTLRSAGFSVPVTMAAAGAVTVNIENVGTAVVSTYADPVNHQLTAVQG
jgi:hypothetical protein